MTSTTLTDPLAPLAARLDGTLARPGEPGYELALPWNRSVAMTPRAVIAAASAQDVVETVRFAGDHGLRVAVQRTGHGASPLDNGGDDVILIHTGGLDAVVVDPQARVARVGGGAVWQQVMDAAAAHGLMALCGSSPGVGVAGFVTGGGVGPLVRTYGLTSDRVRSFDVVTGEGRLVRASADECAELFWGLRGGKNRLGIVVSLELELIELAELHGGALCFDGADAEAIVRTWAAWSADLPEDVDSSLAIMQLPPLPSVPPPLAGRLTVAVRYASPSPGDRLGPLRAVATPLIDTVGPMAPASMGAIHNDPVDPMPSHEGTALLRELPDAAVDALLAHALDGSPQVIVELRRLGGALARPAATASAFCHRDVAYNLLTIGIPSPGVPEHAAALTAALAPWSTGSAMPNFARGAESCYDEHTRVWLSALADRHDPAGVLRVGAAVRNA